MKNRIFFPSIIKSVTVLAIVAAMVFAAGCSSDDPKKESPPETITRVKLIFTPAGGGTSITSEATDEDGADGTAFDVVFDQDINLQANTAYTLNIEIYNDLIDEGEDGYDVAEEVEAEGDEHQFFFAWSSGIFTSPTGDGNVDDEADPINYVDFDVNELPVGLVTTWTTSAEGASGKEFTVVLAHLGDAKSATSSVTSDLDIDLTFTINVIPGV